MKNRLKRHMSIIRCVITVGGVLWCGIGSVHARPKYNSEFHKMYPKLAAVAKAARCNVCHVGKKRKSRNDFGVAISQALVAKNVKDSAAIRRAFRAAEAKKVFTQLDNGKDLTGWIGNTTGWTVMDGTIRLSAKQARENIYAKAMHSRNCIIRFQFRATAGADSGIYIHGKQFQVRDYPKAGPAEYASAAKPAGEWNKLEFDISDGVAAVKLNGKVIEKAWKIGSAADQGVGLQKEKGDFEFRYLRFRNKKSTGGESYGDLIKSGRLPDRIIKK